MSQTIQQTANITLARGLTSINNGSFNSTYVDMKNYDRALFAVTVGSDGASSNFRIELLQSLNTSVLGSKAISAVTNVTHNSTANTVKLIECRVDDLDVANAYGNVGIKVTELAEVACNVSAICMRTPSRYPQATLPV